MNNESTPPHGVYSFMIARAHAALIFCFAISLHAATEPATHLTIANRDVAIWKPTSSAPKSGYPLILFSHGYTGCNTQSVFLMEALARAGYFVIAPNHHDATCGSAKQGWYPGKMVANRPQQPFRDPQPWSDQTYRDRYNDIEAVLNEVVREKTFAGVPINGNAIGLAGHSLGGYTVLGLAGGWSSWKDPRIKAVLALSPHCSPFLDHGNLNFDIPIMYQGGTRDLGETPLVRRTNGAYDRSSAPKYYIELDGAGHFAWTDLNRTYQQTINTYSIAFFDLYLKHLDDPDPLHPLTNRPFAKQITDVRAKVN